MTLVSPSKAKPVSYTPSSRAQPHVIPWQHAKCILDDCHCEPVNVHFAVSFVSIWVSNGAKAVVGVAIVAGVLALLVANFWA